MSRTEVTLPIFTSLKHSGVTARPPTPRRPRPHPSTPDARVGPAGELGAGTRARGASRESRSALRARETPPCARRSLPRLPSHTQPCSPAPASRTPIPVRGRGRHHPSKDPPPHSLNRRPRRPAATAGCQAPRPGSPCQTRATARGWWLGSWGVGFAGGSASTASPPSPLSSHLHPTAASGAYSQSQNGISSVMARQNRDWGAPAAAASAA